MIQRIQSIFLVLAGAAFGALFALPFATSNQSTATLLADQTFDVSDHILLMILAGLGAVVAVASLFMFKNRKLQIKLGYLLIILGILIPIAAFMLFTNDTKDMGQAVAVADGLGAYIPFLSIIFAFAANYFIKKDDKLVKSMDRLR